MSPAQMVRKGWTSNHPGLGHWVLPLMRSGVGLPGGEGRGVSWEGILAVPRASGPSGSCHWALQLFLLPCKEAICEVRMKTEQTCPEPLF